MQEQPSEGLPTSEIRGTSTKASGRTPLYVTFAEKDKAIACGARWDREARVWYAPKGADLVALGPWLEPPRVLTVAEMEVQFLKALQDAGLIPPEHLRLDGEWHAVKAVASANPKATPGSYKGDLTGEHPNGYIVNNVTGYKGPWRPEGTVSLSPEQRAGFRAQREARDAELDERRLEVAARCEAKFKRLPAAGPDHPYLLRKQVPSFGLREDGGRLVVPAQDASGKVWNLQHISPEPGAPKNYEKDGQKAGRFFMLGDLDGAAAAFVVEGYATGASVHLATGLPVAVCFDAGNIAAVIAALKEVNPQALYVVAGDDDVLSVERVHDHVRRRGLAHPELGSHGISLAEAARVGHGPVRLESEPWCVVDCKFVDGPEGIQRLVGTLGTKADQGPVLLMNSGREKAMAASRQFGVPAVFPVFGSDKGCPTDFNDLHIREGLQAVRHAVLDGLRLAGVDVSLQALVERAASAGHEVSAAAPGGRYSGKVLGTSLDHSVQEVGRGRAVQHELKQLDRAPVVGQPASVSYRGDRGQVEQRGRPDRSHER